MAVDATTITSAQEQAAMQIAVQIYGAEAKQNAAGLINELGVPDEVGQIVLDALGARIDAIAGFGERQKVAELLAGAADVLGRAVSSGANIQTVNLPVDMTVPTDDSSGYALDDTPPSVVDSGDREPDIAGIDTDKTLLCNRKPSKEDPKEGIEPAPGIPQGDQVLTEAPAPLLPYGLEPADVPAVATLDPLLNLPEGQKRERVWRQNEFLVHIFGPSWEDAIAGLTLPQRIAIGDALGRIYEGFEIPRLKAPGAKEERAEQMRLFLRGHTLDEISGNYEGISPGAIKQRLTPGMHHSITSRVEPEILEAIIVDVTSTGVAANGVSDSENLGVDDPRAGATETEKGDQLGELTGLLDVDAANMLVDDAIESAAEHMHMSIDAEIKTFKALFSLFTTKRIRTADFDETRDDIRLALELVREGTGLIAKQQLSVIEVATIIGVIGESNEDAQIWQAVRHHLYNDMPVFAEEVDRLGGLDGGGAEKVLAKALTKLGLARSSQMGA